MSGMSPGHYYRPPMFGEDMKAYWAKMKQESEASDRALRTWIRGLLLMMIVVGGLLIAAMLALVGFAIWTELQ